MVTTPEGELAATAVTPPGGTFRRCIGCVQHRILRMRRGYVGRRCWRSASSQDLLFLRGVDQSTAHQSWEFVLRNDRCQITCQSAPEVSRAQAPPALTRTTSGSWSRRSLAVSSAALLGGELSPRVVA